MASQPFTAAYHNSLVPLEGNYSVSEVIPGYPDNLSLSGGGKRKNKRRSKKRSKRSKRSRRSSRRNPEEKVVRGARLQTRPSASHYYNKLNKPVGYKISYRPRKGGKYIMHELALRKNGTPFWKALEKLPKKSRMTRRNSRKRNTRKRNTRKRNGGSSAEKMDEMEIWDVPMVVALQSFKPEDDKSRVPLIKGRSYKILGKQEIERHVKVKDARWDMLVSYVPMDLLIFDGSPNVSILKVKANNDWSASGRIIPDNRFFTYSNAIDITEGSTYIIFPALEISGPEGSERIYNYGGPQGGTLDKFGYFPKRFVEIPP
jgi:hypothetical protein